MYKKHFLHDSYQRRMKAKKEEIIKRIEEARDKDQIAEYPYNRCIKIIREVLGDD